MLTRFLIEGIGLFKISPRADCAVIMQNKKSINNLNLAKIKENIWMLAEDIPNINFNFCQIWLASFTNNLSKACGKNYREVISIHNGFDMKFYFQENDSAEFSKYVLNKIIKSPQFGKKINYEIINGSDKLKKYAIKLEPEFLSKLSDKELSRIFTDLDKIHTDLYSWGWLPNAVDMFQNDYTIFLKQLLRKKINENQINQSLINLTTSNKKSILQEEHESFLKLVDIAQTNREKLSIAINKHLRKYFYLKYLWLGKDGVYDYDYYLNEISKFIKSKERANELLKKKKTYGGALKERKKIIKQAKLNKKEIDLFDIYADFAVTKAYRRDAQIYWSYKMGFLLSELGKRLNLPKKLIYFLLPIEIEGLLNNKISTKKIIKELVERSKLMVYCTAKGEERVIVGASALAIDKIFKKEEKSDTKELIGQTACMGKVKGKVRIINSPSDMLKMKKGDILVSIATNPDIVASMKKAAAIITEQGGVTCHAAIVSRELGIPCIIGTKIATKVLKDGDLVEVDADRGVVKIIK